MSGILFERTSLHREAKRESPKLSLFKTVVEKREVYLNTLTLLHSEQPKLCSECNRFFMAVLIAIGVCFLLF